MNHKGRVLILDGGCGNLNAIRNMLDFLGEKCEISSDPHNIKSAKMLILPGVGAFDSLMMNLRERQLYNLIIEIANKGIPVIGICLGAQILFEGSEEGKLPGLGLLEGHCDSFAKSVQSTSEFTLNVGWAAVQTVSESIFKSELNETSFYFSHSYRFVPKNKNIVSHQIKNSDLIPAIVEKDNVIGIQFHPEKSNKSGILLFKRLMEWLN